MTFYKRPAVTVDAAIYRIKNSEIEVLVVKRKNDPFKGYYAFCGGFVDYGEDPKDAVLRELKEETNLDGKNPILFDVRGAPDRDPRGHTISIFYSVEMVDPNQEPKGGDDAAEAMFVPLSTVLGLNFDKDLNAVINSQTLPMAFDHLNGFKSFYTWLKKENLI
ncbi:adp-ribose pyrophosphatase [Anaeramoeba ignava]|uniref:Adp-ribose pyrophosphatase n=1 Tax=Anaeramoeba ignava TaxID=1746090 RepID=A0A9Q0L862_ANAIG|nr:adp-ribose pyrophosphatase [Anaeramoeba ignava]